MTEPSPLCLTEWHPNLHQSAFAQWHQSIHMSNSQIFPQVKITAASWSNWTHTLVSPHVNTEDKERRFTFWCLAKCCGFGVTTLMRGTFPLGVDVLFLLLISLCSQVCLSCPCSSFLIWYTVLGDKCRKRFTCEKSGNTIWAKPHEVEGNENTLFIGKHDVQHCCFTISVKISSC